MQLSINQRPLPQRLVLKADFSLTVSDQDQNLACYRSDFKTCPELTLRYGYKLKIFLQALIHFIPLKMPAV